MKSKVKTVTASAVTMAAGVAGAALVARSIWSRDTARAVARLTVGTPRSEAFTFDPHIVRDLPPIVRKYFDFALTPGQRRVKGARIEHVGEFRSGLDVGWSPFWSIQHYRIEPPGFVWDARIQMTPFGTVRVRDSYIAGQAAMLGKIAAVVPVVDQHGGRELASGALHRFLAESVWIPTALLPAEGLVWESIDESVARATLRDSGNVVSVDFHFGSNGEITLVEGERFRDVNGLGVPTPFIGQFSEYEEVDGMRIPMEGEVEWDLPEGRLSYWMGRIAHAHFEFA